MGARCRWHRALPACGRGAAYRRACEEDRRAAEEEEPSGKACASNGEAFHVAAEELVPGAGVEHDTGGVVRSRRIGGAGLARAVWAADTMEQRQGLDDDVPRGSNAGVVEHAA